VSHKDIILRKLGHGLVLGHINLDPLRSSGKSFGTLNETLSSVAHVTDRGNLIFFSHSVSHLVSGIIPWLLS